MVAGFFSAIVVATTSIVVPTVAVVVLQLQLLLLLLWLCCCFSCFCFCYYVAIVFYHILAMQDLKVVDVWFCVDNRPFKQALLTIVKKWSFMFKQHLIDHVIKRFTNIINMHSTK